MLLYISRLDVSSLVMVYYLHPYFVSSNSYGLISSNLVGARCVSMAWLNVAQIRDFLALTLCG